MDTRIFSLAGRPIRKVRQSVARLERQGYRTEVADLGTLQRLPGIVGRGHVAELAYTGNDISAERAVEIGLVNQVLPDAETCQKAAQELAREIAANSPLAVQGTKAVLRAGDGSAVAEGLDYVSVWNSAFLQSDDLAEAFTAFLEKREPHFRGQ